MEQPITFPRDVMNISKRIEIALLGFLITLLKESPGFQSIFLILYDFYGKAETVLYQWRFVLPILAWGSVGLVFGFVLGLLVSMFR
jgi:hypothetical protein